MSIGKGKQELKEDYGESSCEEDYKDDNSVDDEDSEIERPKYEIQFLKTFEGHDLNEEVSVINDNEEVFKFPLFIVAKISPIADMLEDMGYIPEEPVPLNGINKEYYDIIMKFYHLETNSERKDYIDNDVMAVTKEITDALDEKRFPTKDEYPKFAREVCQKIEKFCNFVNFCTFGGKGDTDFLLLTKHSFWSIDDEPLMGLYKLINLHNSKLVSDIFDKSFDDKFYKDPNDKLTFRFSKGKIVEEPLSEQQVKDFEEDNENGAPYVEIHEGINNEGETYKYRMIEVPTGENYIHEEYEPRKHDFPVEIIRHYYGHNHLLPTYNNYLEELRINDILEGKIKEC